MLAEVVKYAINIETKFTRWLYPGRSIQDTKPVKKKFMNFVGSKLCACHHNLNDIEFRENVRPIHMLQLHVINLLPNNVYGLNQNSSIKSPVIQNNRHRP